MEKGFLIEGFDEKGNGYRYTLRTSRETGAIVEELLKNSPSNPPRTRLVEVSKQPRFPTETSISDHSTKTETPHCSTIPRERV